MARSTYIYLVRSGGLLDNEIPVAAFTVKHELKSWLERKTPEVRAPMHVYRIRDGREEAVIEISVLDILAGR